MTTLSLPVTRPVLVAKFLVNKFFRTPGGKQGIWYHKGKFWCWRAEVWKEYTRDQMRAEISRTLMDATVIKEDGSTSPLNPGTSTVEDVTTFVQDLCECPYERLPVWLHGTTPDGLNPDLVVAFRDKLVSVEGGEFKLMDRTEDWLDNGVLDASWEDGQSGECPTWMRCLAEWSGGDPQWIALMQQWMGYNLVPSRRRARWMLKHGSIRGGKGTSDRVLQRIMGPTVCRGMSMMGLTRQFGLTGLVHARSILISECHEMQSAQGSQLASLIKSALGEDPLDVDVKYGAVLQNVVLRCAITVSSNEIPTMPNKGSGLSGKMLVLPFVHSFVDREDFNLEDKLAAERSAIAVWAMQGALQVSGASSRWAVANGTREVMLEYTTYKNPVGQFLEDAMSVRVGNRVDFNEVVWPRWQKWCAENKHTENTSKKELQTRLKEQAGWHLKVVRPVAGGPYYLEGAIPKSWDVRQGPVGPVVGVEDREDTDLQEGPND